MRLAFHQMCSDMRQHRGVICFWLALLGLDLAGNMGWLGNPLFDSSATGLSLGYLGVTGLAALLWTMLFWVPMQLALSDSPGNPNGFLATRPLSRGDLVKAKVLLVLTVVILPALVQELIHLLVLGIPLRYVGHGLLERLVFMVPMVLCSMASAALWASMWQWSLALAAALVCALAFEALAPVLLAAVGINHFFGLAAMNATTLLLGLWILGTGSLVLLSVSLQRRWSVWQRGGANATLVVTTLLLLGFCRIDWFSSIATASAPTALAAATTISVPPGGLSIHRQRAGRSSSSFEFGAVVKPRLEPLKGAEVVEWRCRKLELVLPTGQISRGIPPVWQPGWPSSSRSLVDLRAISLLLGGDPIFFGESGIADERAADLGTFETDSASLPESFRLQASLEGSIFRWQKVGELPLNSGEQVQDAEGVWRLLNVRPFEPSATRLTVERDQIALSTTRNGAIRRFWDLPSDRYEFVLYQTADRPAFVVENLEAPSQLGLHTGYVRTRINLLLRPLQAGVSPEQLSDYRLVIFRKDYERQVQAEWRSASLCGWDFPSDYTPSTPPGGPTLSRAEFLRDWRALRPPAAKPSRMEAGSYVNDVLRLIEANHYMSWEEGDPILNRLVPLVPQHLPVFLDGQAVAGQFGRRALIRAIIQGANERQKNAVIQALRKAPNLAEVIVARDWISTAKPVLYALAQSDRALPFEALQALAWFEDPQTYPWLLNHFTMNPTVAQYDLLRLPPGIQDGLKATLDRLWQRRPPWYYNMRQSLPLVFPAVLRAGRWEAFRDAYRLFELVPEGERTMNISLLQALAECIHAEELSLTTRYDYPFVEGWLAQHHADDFRYHAGRRQFVLKGEIGKL